MATELSRSEVEAGIAQARSVVGEHRSDVTRIYGMGPSFAVAAGGQWAAAIQEALNNARDTGVRLSNSLDFIVDKLGESKNNMGSSDQEVAKDIRNVDVNPQLSSNLIKTSDITHTQG